MNFLAVLPFPWILQRSKNALLCLAFPQMFCPWFAILYLRCSLLVINCGYHFFAFGSKAQYICHWSRLSRHEIALIESERFFFRKKESLHCGKEFPKPDKVLKTSILYQLWTNKLDPINFPAAQLQLCSSLLLQYILAYMLLFKQC